MNWRRWMNSRILVDIEWTIESLVDIDNGIWLRLVGFNGIKENRDTSSETDLGRTKQSSVVEIVNLDAYGKISSWKITSWDTSTDLVVRSNNLHLLIP